MELPTAENPAVLIHGDCLDVLRRLPDGCVDAVVTDPPYGTEAERDGYGRRQKWAGAQRIANDTDLLAWGAALSVLARVLRPDAWIVFFCSPKRRDDVGDVTRTWGARILGEVVWDKRSPGLGGGIRYQHETALLASFGDPSGRCQLASILGEWVPKGQNGHRQQFHTHEKPVGVVGSLIEYASDAGGVILDPFAGSGTTGVACVQTGRRFIGCEIDATRYATARRRIDDALGVGGLFAPPAAPSPVPLYA